MLRHFQVNAIHLCASAYKPPAFLALTLDSESHASLPSHAHLLTPSHHPLLKTLIKSCVALMNNHHVFNSFGVSFDLALSWHEGSRER